MLTLITGSPGAGKTALAVSMLRDFIKVNPSRPVFVMGIPDLKLPHSPVPPFDEWVRQVASPDDSTVMLWEFSFPEGALIIIDEAQSVFRPRAQGVKVPPHVAAFETHRHLGIDFWLITQHPGLIDANIRKLVRKHNHLRQHWAGREVLEWSEAVDPSSRTDRAVAVRRPFRLPKSIFSEYRSASLHVKTRQRVPLAAWVFLAVVLVGSVVGWRVYSRVSGAIEGEAPAAAATKPKVGEGGEAPQARSGGVVPTLEAFKPRLLGRPESAPIYDEVRKVVAAPMVAGCAAVRSRCTCYTDQGSDAGLSDAECRAWLASPPFSPFRHVWPAAAEKRVEREAPPS